MNTTQTTSPKTANCRDCDRRLLTADMKQDGLGSWFCKPCHAAAVALLNG